MDKLNPMPDEPQTWINTIWEALDHARASYTDEQWDQICMAMAWNTEELNCTDPLTGLSGFRLIAQMTSARGRKVNDG